MLQRPIECVGCPLNPIASGYLRPEGSCTNGVLIVGEAAGEAEARDGFPFRPYAQAGHILDRCIRKAGLRREEFAFWNMCGCRPPFNKLEGQWYEKGAIEHCSVHFRRVLERFRPRAILGLGNIPLKWLTGMAGQKSSISLLRGFVFDSIYGIPIVPSLHPAFIARGKGNFIGTLIRDILFAVEVAKHGIPDDTKDYIERPTVGDARIWLAALRSDKRFPPISFDIETDYSLKEPDEGEVENKGQNIVQIQFSTAPGMAIVLPWIGDYIAVAKQILELTNDKWGWNNWAFDEPILAAHQARVSGKSYDLMWAWHHLQPDLPRGLQFACSFYAPEVRAWKHLSDSQPEFYGAVDVDAVQRIGQRIFTDQDTAGCRRGYERHIADLWPVLKKMCDRGFPVDRASRDAFRAEVESSRESLDRELQGRIPEQLRRIKPAAGFKATPPAVKKIALEMGVLTTKGREKIFPEGFKQRVKQELGFDCKEFADGFDRFFRHLPFLPSSSDQLKAYIKAKGHKMPTKLKEVDEDGNPKETTDKKSLERLYKQTGDDFYLKVVEHRELQKIVSTYVDGWKLDDNDRVHSTFLFAPATGQLSSRDPNIQNIPKHGGLADAFRRTIRPRTGHVLVEFDYTAFHALTLGFEANDPDYMRLARLDIHSYLAGHLLGLEGRHDWLQLPTNDLRDKLAEIKAQHKYVRDKKAKPTVLGYGFGLGAQKLYDMNVESFTSKREAQDVINMLNELFPKTAGFREDIKALASKQGYLLSRHGYIRRFYDIYGYRQVSEKYEPESGEILYVGRNGRRYKRVTGEEGESAIAFLPANDAFGHIKDIMLTLEETGANERYRLINQIHDALLFECPVRLVDDCLAEVGGLMEAPSTVLVSAVAPDGLACGIEASVGKESWAAMEKVYGTPIDKVLH